MPLTYSRENFERRLAAVVPTIDSIQSLSYFMLFLRERHAEALVDSWLGVFRAAGEREEAAPATTALAGERAGGGEDDEDDDESAGSATTVAADAERRISLLYVANDVLQQVRRARGSDGDGEDDGEDHRSLTSVFYRALEAVLADVGEDDRVQKMLNVWSERDVFGADKIQRLRATLDARAESRVRVRAVEKTLAQATERLASHHDDEDAAYAEVLERTRHAHTAAQRYLEVAATASRPHKTPPADDDNSDASETMDAVSGAEPSA